MCLYRLYKRLCESVEPCTVRKLYQLFVWICETSLNKCCHFSITILACPGYWSYSYHEKHVSISAHSLWLSKGNNISQPVTFDWHKESCLKSTLKAPNVTRMTNIHNHCVQTIFRRCVKVSTVPKSCSDTYNDSGRVSALHKYFHSNGYSMSHSTCKKQKSFSSVYFHICT